MSCPSVYFVTEAPNGKNQFATRRGTQGVSTSWGVCLVVSFSLSVFFGFFGGTFFGSLGYALPVFCFSWLV
jgi:hypothetical protein